MFTHDKILLTCIESNYNILSNELFKKLFKKHNTKFIITSVPNPYTKSLPICNLNYTDNILSCDTGVIEGEQCLGHFDHYPAVPIAMLGSIMAEIGGMHLKKQLDNDNFKYYIKSGILTASKLTFFGETIFIKSMKIDDDKTIHKYLITGTDKDSNELGKLEVIFDSYEL